MLYLYAQEGCHPPHYINPFVQTQNGMMHLSSLHSCQVILLVIGIFKLQSSHGLQAGAGSESSSRLVVTFRAASDNEVDLKDLDGIRVVKQYGRRLVLDLGAPFDLEVERVKFEALFKSVQSIETDYLIGLHQTQDQLTVSDALLVTNATDPSVDGAAISFTTQTPLWNLLDNEPYSIHAEGVWAVTNSTPDVVVAVIDTGLAGPAKSMFLNLLDGYDFISDDGISIDGDGRDPDSTDPGDWGDMCPTPSWHGTKVASILAARHDNEFGMKGVAQNCSVLPVRVLGLCRMGYATDVTDAIVWSAGGTINGVPSNPNPAKIISLSLAGQGACPDYLQSAVTQALALGSTIVAAAGNSNQDVSGHFPANCIGIISVAAITRAGKLAAYSNWGDSIKISAPGGDSTNAIMTLGINSLETLPETVYGTGTSFAAPHISGVGALIGITSLNQLIASWKDFVSASTTSPYNTCSSEACSAQIISGKMSNFSGVFAAGTCTGTNSMALCGVVGLFYSCGACSCPSGYYYTSNYDGYQHYNEGCYSCTSCGTGQYLSACSSMGPGYCTSCAVCSPGSYQSVSCTTTSDAVCGPCTSNSYCLGGTSQPVAWTITTCTIGNYLSAAPSASANGACLPCPASSYCTGGASSYTAWTITTCTLGNYLFTAPSASANGACLPCPANSYCTGGTSTYAAWTITTCTLGNYLSAAPSATANGVCSPCTATKYCPGGTSQPVSWTITTCTAGNYLNPVPSASANGACSPCIANNYCLGGANQPAAWTITTCTLGNYLSAAPSATANGVCSPCIANNYCPGGTSQPVPWTITTCTLGTYLNPTPSATANGACPQCPATKYCLGGTSAPAACSQSPVCQPPTFIQSCTATTDATCTQCNNSKLPLNSDWISGLNSCIWACNRVPSYYYKLNSANCNYCQACRTPSSCVKGQYVTTCTATADGVCTPCTNKPPLNTHYTSASSSYDQNNCAWTCDDGYSQGASTCDICPAGKYAVDSPSSCTACSPGSYSLAGASACTACSPGTYSSASAQSACKCMSGTCSPGKYNNAQYLSGCGTCGAGTFSTAYGTATCSQCDPGTYSTAGASACTSCNAGSYSSAAGQTACPSCGAGTYSPTGASVCTGCSAGSYSSAASQIVCSSCVAGTYSATGASVCTSCSAGSYSTAAGQTGVSTCSSCGAGTYSATGASMCSQCGPGKYSVAGAGVCTSCSAGSYSSAAIQIACSSCGAGTYSTTGASVCTSCSAGSYSTAAGQTAVSSCSSCGPGTYSGIGASVCSPCSSTSYTPATGATACTLCPLCSVNGNYRSGCSGTSSGKCDKCTNTN